MADSVEIASAYVALTTKMPGVKKDVEASLGEADGVATSSGLSAGKKWGAALAVGVAAAAAVVTAAVAGLYKIGGVFDDVSDTIRVQTGASGDALNGLVDVANKVGATVPAQFGKVGTTVADLNTRLGLSGDQLQTVASQYLEAGRMLGQDVDIQSSTAAFNAFQLKNEDVSGALDTMFRVAQATGIGMNELSSTMVTAAPLVQNLGFGFEDTAALVGTLDKAGLDANRMLMTLGPGLVNMAKDGEQPAEVFPRVIGQLQDLISAGDTAGAINLAGGIFGTRGAAQFVAAIQSGKVNLDDLMGGIGATSDTILGLSKETSDAAEGWQVFKNNALLAVKPVADAIFGLAGGAMSKIADWAQKNGPMIAKFLEPIGQAISDILPTVLQLWTQLSPVSILFKALQPVLPLLGQAIAQLAEPLGMIVQMFGSLVAQIMPILMPILVQIITVFTQILAAVIPVVASLVEGLMPIFVALIPIVLQIVEAILPLVSVLLDSLMPIIESLLPLFGPDGLGGVIAALAPIIAALLPPILGVVQMIAGLLLPIIKAITDVLSGLIDFLVGAFTGDWEKAWGGIVKIFSGIWNGILGIAEAAINGVIDLINGIIGGINGISGALGIPPIGLIGHVSFVGAGTSPGKGTQIARGPMAFAEGGLVSHRPGGMLAQIGEGRYDELVLPLSPKVLSQLATGSGSGSGFTLQYHAAPNQSFDAETDLMVALERTGLARAVIA